jgi:hypothetical protein
LLAADELTGETLQDLGTIYRLHGVHEVALQHLERALTIRERCHGKDSLKVAETLNSLALVNLVYATQGCLTSRDFFYFQD